MRRGEVWFAAVPGGGDRPVLVLTRDPVADRIGHLVVAALTRTRRNLVSELPIGEADGMPVESVISFDNLRTVPKANLTTRLGSLGPDATARICAALGALADCE